MTRKIVGGVSLLLGAGVIVRYLTDSAPGGFTPADWLMPALLIVLSAYLLMKPSPATTE